MRQKQRVFSLFLLSPSSRRAWIEIYQSIVLRRAEAVALLAEGVDRNNALLMRAKELPGRPPRGGRG